MKLIKIPSGLKIGVDDFEAKGEHLAGVSLLASNDVNTAILCCKA